MKAIVLAAGQGTRLRPLTNDQPKCMVPLAGKPLLHRQLEVLRGAGIDEIVVVGGYRAERLEAPGLRVVLNRRYAETNMVSTLFCAESEMSRSEDLVIAYGDIVYEPRVLDALLACEAPLAIAIDRQWRRYWELRMDDPLADAETLKLDDGDRIVELGRKPQDYGDIQGQYMGLIKVAGERIQAFREAYHALDRAGRYDGKDFDNMYMTSFLQNLIDTGWLARAAFTDNGWLEVDTVADLERYEALQAQGRLEQFYRLV